MPTENENSEIILSGSAVILKTQAKQVSLLRNSLFPYVWTEPLFLRCRTEVNEFSCAYLRVKL